MKRVSAFKGDDGKLYPTKEACATADLQEQVRKLDHMMRLNYTGALSGIMHGASTTPLSNMLVDLEKQIRECHAAMGDYVELCRQPVEETKS